MGKHLTLVLAFMPALNKIVGAIEAAQKDHKVTVGEVIDIAYLAFNEMANELGVAKKVIWEDAEEDGGQSPKA